MSKTSRAILLVAALMLSATYFLPLWQIQLKAPQYPEGLGIQIWINKMTGINEGDLNKINNLNHYIGMKTIQPDSIKELQIMPWVMRGVMILGIALALVARPRYLWIWLAVFAVVAIAGLVDYYIWGYDYGHNLDQAKAIIKVPGMSYQPPLIGSKKLLNFTAISLPGSGGVVAMVSFLIWAAVTWRLWRQRVNSDRRQSKPVLAPIAAATLLTLTLLGCTGSQPRPINYGSDECAYCKMTIVEPGYGSALMTAKGRQLNFDSIECLVAYRLKNQTQDQNGWTNWVSAVDAPGTLYSQDKVHLVHSGEIRSPMGAGLAAFTSTEAADAASREAHGRRLDWTDLKSLIRQEWSIE